jgi:hypothetical protein
VLAAPAPVADAAQNLSEMLERSEKAGAERLAEADRLAWTRGRPVTTPPVVAATVTPPVVAVTVETKKRGAPRKPIPTAEALKIVAKRTLKKIDKIEPDLRNCVEVRDAVAPVWSSTVKGNFEGYVTAFAKHMLIPLWDRSDQSLDEFAGEKVAWRASDIRRDPNVLMWSETNGLTVRPIMAPDDDDPKGEPDKHAQDTPDGAASDPALAADPTLAAPQEPVPEGVAQQDQQADTGTPEEVEVPPELSGLFNRGKK